MSIHPHFHLHFHHQLPTSTFPSSHFNCLCQPSKMEYTHTDTHTPTLCLSDSIVCSISTPIPISLPINYYPLLSRSFIPPVPLRCRIISSCHLGSLPPKSPHDRIRPPPIPSQPPGETQGRRPFVWVQYLYLWLVWCLCGVLFDKLVTGDPNPAVYVHVCTYIFPLGCPVDQQCHHSRFLSGGDHHCQNVNVNSFS